jgi:hypothetical protein
MALAKANVLDQDFFGILRLNREGGLLKSIRRVVSTTERSLAALGERRATLASFSAMRLRPNGFTHAASDENLLGKRAKRGRPSQSCPW